MPSSGERIAVHDYDFVLILPQGDFLHRHWPDGLICGRELSSRPGMDGTREIA